MYSFIIPICQHCVCLVCWFIITWCTELWVVSLFCWWIKVFKNGSVIRQYHTPQCCSHRRAAENSRQRNYYTVHVDDSESLTGSSAAILHGHYSRFADSSTMLYVRLLGARQCGFEAVTQRTVVCRATKMASVWLRSTLIPDRFLWSFRSQTGG